MHAKNFYSEFLDILKNDFRPVGPYAPMNFRHMPSIESYERKELTEVVAFFFAPLSDYTEARETVATASIPFLVAPDPFLFGPLSPSPHPSAPISSSELFPVKQQRRHRCRPPFSPPRHPFIPSRSSLRVKKHRHTRRETPLRFVDIWPIRDWFQLSTLEFTSFSRWFGGFLAASGTTSPNVLRMPSLNHTGFCFHPFC
jgi:hypothetical protein